MKRIVRLKNKLTGEINSYPTITDLIHRNGEKSIGIGLQSLYNAMSGNHGRWENNNYEIYYEEIEISITTW